MKKESKNLGFCKACPECRKTLIKSADIIGKGTFKTKCPHCKSLIKVEIGQKTSITLTKILLTALIVIGIYQVFTMTMFKNAFVALTNEYEIDVIK